MSRSEEGQCWTGEACEWDGMLYVLEETLTLFCSFLSSRQVKVEQRERAARVRYVLATQLYYRRIKDGVAAIITSPVTRICSPVPLATVFGWANPTVRQPASSIARPWWGCVDVVRRLC